MADLGDLTVGPLLGSRAGSLIHGMACVILPSLAEATKLADWQTFGAKSPRPPLQRGQFSHFTKVEQGGFPLSPESP